MCNAEGYIYMNCLWVSGSMKGHGYSNDLLDECIRDARAQGRKGLCILSSEKRKKEFLSDPKYMAYKGFSVADTSETGICAECACPSHYLCPVPGWNVPAPRDSIGQEVSGSRGSGNLTALKILRFGL